MDSRGSARTNPLSRLRGVAVGAKNKVLGKGVGRDDEAPAVLSSEVCLVPGAPVVRVTEDYVWIQLVITWTTRVAPRRMACGWSVALDRESI